MKFTTLLLWKLVCVHFHLIQRAWHPVVKFGRLFAILYQQELDQYKQLIVRRTYFVPGTCVEGGNYMQTDSPVDRCREGLTVEERRALCHLFDELPEKTVDPERFSDTGAIKAQ